MFEYIRFLLGVVAIQRTISSPLHYEANVDNNAIFGPALLHFFLKFVTSLRLILFMQFFGPGYFNAAFSIILIFPRRWNLCFASRLLSAIAHTAIVWALMLLNFNIYIHFTSIIQYFKCLYLWMNSSTILL